jgi:hypothetical protein
MVQTELRANASAFIKRSPADLKCQRLGTFLDWQEREIPPHGEITVIFQLFSGEDCSDPIIVVEDLEDAIVAASGTNIPGCGRTVFVSALHAFQSKN